MEDPETRKMELSQILHMRLLAMRNDEEPEYSLKPPSLAGAEDARSDGPLTFSDDGDHVIEYKKYAENIDRQPRTIHENRIDPTGQGPSRSILKNCFYFTYRLPYIELCRLFFRALEAPFRNQVRASTSS